MRKLIHKKAKKISDGKCCFCGEKDYILLEVHRILEGSKGGIYSSHNTITTCSHCHKKIHAGNIKIDRKYYSTAGIWVVHCWVEGEEKWLPE